MASSESISMKRFVLTNAIIEQRKTFFDELVLYLEGVRQEQNLRLKGILPTVADYWTMRYNSSGCGTTNSLIEYIIRTSTLERAIG